MKKELKLRTVVAPSPAIIVAAYDENGKPSACTLAFYMPSSHQPPCVTIGIRATGKRKTLQCILKSGAFTVGYPGVDQVEQMDYIGVESGYDADKLENLGLTTSRAKTVDAPIIDALRLTLECEVIHSAQVGGHIHITGEIKNIIADESILNEKGMVILDKLNPIIYDEESFTYRTVGKSFADAYKIGGKMKKEFAEKKSSTE